MPPLLTLNGIKVHFSARKMLFRADIVRAVDGVSLSLNRGETVSVVGESGSGKTTLGRASLRLAPITEGTVVFDGDDITRIPDGKLRWFRRRAQAVFQDPYSSIDPFMDVRQVLEEPLLIHAIQDRADRVHQALEEVRLAPAGEFSGKFPHMLSGGQRQRVGIARALIMQPDYILADEPVSMIDASSRTEILYLMRELQERMGIAFLYITHDIATARYFSDRIAVLYLGRVAEQGLPGEVLDDPMHPYTVALIAAVPEADPDNRLRDRPTVPGEPPNPANVPTGCRFHPRCPEFMAGLCDVVEPELVEARIGRFVACHLYSPVTHADGAETARPTEV
ncbi:MAG: ABC transporter ATP-binding protein [Chloroflexi bacterium]|nr:ABC transporter ATP-binding protein [Chloroflexota bacterium]